MEYSRVYTCSSREVECLYDGDVAEKIENINSWEKCAELCNLNNYAAWTFRSEPKTECMLYEDSTKRCYAAITPSNVDPKSCASTSHDIEGDKDFSQQMKYISQPFMYV